MIQPASLQPAASEASAVPPSQLTPVAAAAAASKGRYITLGSIGSKLLALPAAALDMARAIMEIIRQFLRRVAASLGVDLREQSPGGDSPNGQAPEGDSAADLVDGASSVPRMGFAAPEGTSPEDVERVGRAMNQAAGDADRLLADPLAAGSFGQWMRDSVQSFEREASRLRLEIKDSEAEIHKIVFFAAVASDVPPSKAIELLEARDPALKVSAEMLDSYGRHRSRVDAAERGLVRLQQLTASMMDSPEAQAMDLDEISSFRRRIALAGLQAANDDVAAGEADAAVADESSAVAAAAAPTDADHDHEQPSAASSGMGDSSPSDRPPMRGG